MSRMSSLLKKSAKLYEESSDPFNSDFLCDNNVTADECKDLSELIGLGCQFMAFAINNPRLIEPMMNAAQLRQCYLNMQKVLAESFGGLISEKNLHCNQDL